MRNNKVRIAECGLRIGAMMIGSLLWAAPVAAAEQKADPSFLHGVGQVIDGLVLEFPKTVLDGTLEGPPVVGTVFGALAGVVRAGQKTVGGMLEMSAGFDPWGTKRNHR